MMFCAFYNHVIFVDYILFEDVSSQKCSETSFQHSVVSITCPSGILLAVIEGWVTCLHQGY